jgi:hypothetical protein
MNDILTPRYLPPWIPMDFLNGMASMGTNIPMTTRGGRREYNGLFILYIECVLQYRMLSARGDGGVELFLIKIKIDPWDIGAKSVHL